MDVGRGLRFKNRFIFQRVQIQTILYVSTIASAENSLHRRGARFGK